MNIRIPSFAALLTLIPLLTPTLLPACSSVAIVMDGKVLLGNHNDNSLALNMLLRVIPHRDGCFGRICISLENVPGWVPTAMKCVNEKGLAITHANVPETDTPYDPDKPELQHNFLEKIAAECATVKQAIAVLRAYSLPPAPHFGHIHLMLADATGDTAIVEWADGEVKVVRRSGATQIMTNSLICKPSATEGPNSRLHRGQRMLAAVKEASVDNLVSVLKEISIRGRHQGDEVGSVESAIFDLTGGKVHLYYQRDFDHPLTLDLYDEIAKGPRTVEFKTLFPNPVPFEPGYRYEDGPIPAKPPAAKSETNAAEGSCAAGSSAAAPGQLRDFPRACSQTPLNAVARRTSQ